MKPYIKIFPKKLAEDVEPKREVVFVPKAKALAKAREIFRRFQPVFKDLENR